MLALHHIRSSIKPMLMKCCWNTLGGKHFFIGSTNMSLSFTHSQMNMHFVSRYRSDYLNYYCLKRLQKNWVIIIDFLLATLHNWQSWVLLSNSSTISCCIITYFAIILRLLLTFTCTSSKILVLVKTKYVS